MAEFTIEEVLAERAVTHELATGSTVDDQVVVCAHCAAGNLIRVVDPVGELRWECTPCGRVNVASFAPVVEVVASEAGTGADVVTAP